jgi:molybdopterin-dependent oxidoreductase alpha subunit|nr:FdhF/YdeP family oxidoreductase [Kofleriaceae bacterium]
MADDRDADDRDAAGDPPKADVRITDVPHSAGGVGAMIATADHLRRAGLVRGSRALLHMNQPAGFDCPGCAWPEAPSAVRHKLEFCENGAKALAEEAMTARATPDSFAAVTVDDLRALSDFELGQLGRLTHPMVLDHTRHYRPISWDAAFKLVADEMRAAGPAATTLYTSGRCSNEAAFLYQLVGRMFGTNNFPDCSNMCHESSGVALGETIGVGKGTVSLDDFEHADLILVVGQNPGTNHPRMLTTLRECAKRGATIIAINPLREVGLVRFAHPQAPLDVLAGGVELAREVIQVQVGGDHALFLGVAKALLEDHAGSLDRAFLDELTTGFDDYAAHVRATPWAALVTGSGIDEATIRRLAATYAGARATITCWAMGLTQHKHAVVTIQEIVNVMLLRGNVGRPGAGLCPVRGHSNVQGDRTMGIDHAPKPAFLDALGLACNFAPPRDPGLDVVETIHAIERGDVRAAMFLGGNFVSASPDTERTARALERCSLTVSVATKLNRTHLHPGARALLLPCLGRSEIDAGTLGPQFVSVEDSMSMVHASRGVLAPASDELRSEVAIIAGIAGALLGPRMPWDDLAGDYDRIRALIERVVPGFADFNARIRTADGFQLPNVARDRSFTPVAGRARFTVATPPDLALPPGRLRLMTMRSHDQYNTTIYGLDDRYRGIRGERRVVFVHSADMVARHLVERQLVDIISEWDDGERVAESFIVVPFDVPRGNCAAYFPEANALVPLGSVADKSNTPTSKSVVVRLRARR